MIEKFKQGDRVTFLGDSITHLNYFTNYIYQYYRDHFPDVKFSIFNCGIAGATAKTGLDFLDIDFNKTHPNKVFVMYGMNDSDRDALDLSDEKIKNRRLNKAFKNYKINIDTLYKKLTSEGYDVTLCTPTPYEEIYESDQPMLKGCTQLIEKFARFIRHYAKTNNIKLIDYHPYMTKMVKKHPGAIKPDHVHPTDLIGHFYIAKFFLKQQGLKLTKHRIDKDILKLHQATYSYRDLYAAEFLFLGKDKTKEEKLKIAENFKEDGEKNIFYPYFCELADNYVKYGGDKETYFNKLLEMVKNI